VPIKQPPVPVDFGWREPLRSECEQFLASVTTRRPPPTDGAEGLRTLAVLQAAQRSLVTQGRPVLLPFDLRAVAG
jgi:predicted dehydrogenase